MKTLLCLLACLLFVACGGGNEQSSSQATAEGGHGEAQAEATTEAAGHEGHVAAGTYDVACGCSIASIGHCGNYIKVDGAPYEIANSQEMGLGEMAWCGQTGKTALAEGEIEDGKFVATNFEVQ